MKNIMILDDSPLILNAFKRLFFDEDDYVLFTAGSVLEAFSILETNDIDLVISDMRMPDMNGNDFLDKVRIRFPSVIRVILSASEDEKLVFRALQKGIAKIYLFKPWNNEDVLQYIRRLFETSDSLRGRNLLEIINNTGDLPILKASHRKILDMIDADAEIAEVTGIIDCDQTIATKLLHIVNSAFYGIKTGSVKQAVQFLGLNTIRNLILTSPIIEIEKTREDARFIDHHLKHAFLSNRILANIYEKCLKIKLDELYQTAGLLHNIGVIFLLKHFRADYSRILQKAGESEKPLFESEKESLNITHMEAGAFLLQWWELPYPIVEAALYHHTPFDERIIHKQLVLAVHIAQKYANERVPTPYVDQAFNEEAFAALGLDRNRFEEILSAMEI